MIVWRASRVRRQDSAQLGPSVACAVGLVDRMRGIIGRESLLDHAALWLSPCNAVHTFFVRRTIDVVFLDRNGRVCALRAGVGRRRFAVAWRARAVLEFPAGAIGVMGLGVGTAIEIGEVIPKDSPIRLTHQIVSEFTSGADMTTPSCKPHFCNPASLRTKRILFRSVLIVSLAAIDVSSHLASANDNYLMRDESPISTRSTAVRASSVLPASSAGAGTEGKHNTGRNIRRQGLARIDMGPLARGEAAYQGRRYDVAIDHFGLIAASENHPFAWLRIGNIWHRRGNVPMALDAYAHARDAATPTGQMAKLHDRALMNIALLTLEQARLAIDEVGLDERARISPRWRAEISLRLDELVALVPAGSDEPVVSGAATSGSSRASHDAGNERHRSTKALRPGRLSDSERQELVSKHLARSRSRATAAPAVSARGAATSRQR